MKTGLFHISEVLPSALSDMARARAGVMRCAPSNGESFAYPTPPISRPMRPTSMNGLLLSVMHHLLPPR